ncbi:MAG: hypothetical protein ACTSV7_03070 [Candidatus Baldrarchaeia archaeon]
MDLTYEEIERHLHSVFTGKKIVIIDDIYLLFKHPSNDTKMEAALVYDKLYKKAVDAGMLPTKELEKLIMERKIFTKEDQDNIDSLKSKLHGQEVLLSKTTRVKARSDRIVGVIKDLKNQIREIEYKRQSKLIMAAEIKAEEERSLFFCWACTYDFNTNVLYWSKYEDILNESRLELRGKILNAFLGFYNGIDSGIVRYIARSNLWRIRYVNSQKVSEPLFGVPTSQYTNDMLNLAYWSSYYQNVYDMLPEDRPSDIIIEDDDALDAYMKNYYDERNREDAARRSKKTSGGKLSAFDKEEVIVAQSHELYEDIEYDKPREARALKDRTDIKKKTRRKT